jgi:hypothetical protein
MTRAQDRREELEALLWQEKIPEPLIARILAAADAYAEAMRPRKPKQPAEPKKPPAVHYRADNRAACQPGDPLSSRTWVLTTDPEAVTCGHCRKTLGRGSGDPP